MKQFFFILVVCVSVLIYAINRPLKRTFGDSSATVSILLTSGKIIFDGLNKTNAYPKDNDLIVFTNEWRKIQASILDPQISDYYDIKNWIIIQNIPENPPDNLIILTTRNIDPTSLRTKFTVHDMQKQIRFTPVKKFPILNEFAVLIRADGTSVLVVKRRPETMTYQFIYNGTFFNATTNYNNGLRIKYLSPDGKEIIPANE